MLDSTAHTKIQRVLGMLDQALAADDVDGALQLFADDCHWRDFVSFTWNLKTLAGKEEVGAMLRACLKQVRPSGWGLPDGEVGAAPMASPRASSASRRPSGVARATSSSGTTRYGSC